MPKCGYCGHESRNRVCPKCGNDTSKVVSIDDAKPHFGVLAICLVCLHKWICSVVADTSLFALECPQCHDHDSYASFIPDEYLKAHGKRL